MEGGGGGVKRQMGNRADWSVWAQRQNPVDAKLTEREAGRKKSVKKKKIMV